ncbi:MAG TPA: hypothetical protein VKT80_16950 [Chloroflexota bacterium]|nr:hypothetical protein [Chloroflexota bacterium]
MTFSADGGFFAFYGGSEAFFVATNAPTSAARLNPHLAPNESVTSVAWNPSSNYLVYGVNELNLSHKLFAVPFSGATPGQPVPIPTTDALVYPSYQFVPGSSSLATWAPDLSIVMIDPTQGTTQPLTTADAGRPASAPPFDITPDGAAIAAARASNVVVTLLKPVTPGSTTPITSPFAAAISILSWSSDAKFLAFVARGTGGTPPDQEVYLMRIDGANASSPVGISLSITNTTPALFWQP